MTRWFIHPKDSHTNNVVARELAAHAEAGATSIQLVEGAYLELWEIPFQKLSQLLASARHSSLRFVAYKKEGGGVVRKAPRFFQIGAQKHPYKRPNSSKQSKKSSF